MTKSKNRIRKWPIVFFAVLAFGVVLVPGVGFAKMINTPIEVGGGMPVANWNVSMTGSSNNDVDLMAGTELQTYDFVVRNESAVASDYIITVSGIPSGVKVSLGVGTLQTATNGSITFTETGGALAPNSTREHTLVFQATYDVTEVDDQDISINVEFTQKEPE